MSSANDGRIFSRWLIAFGLVATGCAILLPPCSLGFAIGGVAAAATAVAVYPTRRCLAGGIGSQVIGFWWLFGLLFIDGEWYQFFYD